MQAIAQQSQSLKDQGKSRTLQSEVAKKVEIDESQSLKDQGKSRTKVNIQNIKHETESQSLKDQGKSRTMTIQVETRRSRNPLKIRASLGLRSALTIERVSRSQSLKDQGKSRTGRTVCTCRQGSRNPLKIRASLGQHSMPSVMIAGRNPLKIRASLGPSGRAVTLFTPCRNPLKIRASLGRLEKAKEMNAKSQSLKDQGKSRTVGTSGRACSLSVAIP